MVALLNAILIASVATATGVYTDEHTTGPSDSEMPVCLCVCVHVPYEMCSTFYDT